MKTFIVTLMDYQDRPIRWFNDLGWCQSEVYFRVSNEYYSDTVVKYIIVVPANHIPSK